MTLATQTPPLLNAQFNRKTASTPTKSILASKTFWGIVFTTVAAIAPLIGEKVDAHAFQAKDVAQIVVILCGAASVVIGRVDAGSIYTPNGLPGPNKSDFS
jgi:hypothetical protein